MKEAIGDQKKSNRDCLKGFRFRQENVLRTGYNSLKGSTKL
jgi:hypothetical protein